MPDYFLFDDPALDRKIRELQGELPRHLKPKKHKRKSAEGKTTVGSHTGIVTTDFFEQKGFAFATITSLSPGDNEDRDIFIGSRALKASGLTTIRKGDRISFDRIPSKKKPGNFEAANISLAEPAQAA